MKMGSSSLAIAVCLLICASLQAEVAHADEAAPGPCAERPGEAVTAVFTTIRALHRRALPGPDGTMLRDRQVEALVGQHVAASRFTAEVLRAPWARADEVYRARWPTALGALLQRRLLRALSDPLRYQLTVGDVTVDAACEDATVHLTLTERRRKQVVQLSLRLERRDGPWAVWDVLSPEVSLMRTWRSRFARAARHQGSLEGLDRELGELARRLDVPWPERPHPGPKGAVAPVSASPPD